MKLSDIKLPTGTPVSTRVVASQQPLGWNAPCKIQGFRFWNNQNSVRLMLAIGEDPTTPTTVAVEADATTHGLASALRALADSIHALSGPKSAPRKGNGRPSDLVKNPYA